MMKIKRNLCSKCFVKMREMRKNVLNKNAADERSMITQVCPILFSLKDHRAWGLEKTVFPINLTLKRMTQIESDYTR